MKLISINIECGKHTETVLSLLKKEKPDVVCFQELLEDEFDFYKKELNFEGVYQPFDYRSNYNGTKLSYNVDTNIKGKRHGVAIFAKNIIDSGQIFYLGSKENIEKSFDDYLKDEKCHENKVLVWATIKSEDGEIYKFITTQLPVTNKGEVTAHQLEAIDSMLSKLGSLGEFVLCGDMNAPRGYESFSRIERKYKDNIPVEYKTSIDQNLHRVKGIQFMVDGLFTTHAYEAQDVKLVAGVSDHLAVIAQIIKN